MTMGTQFKKFCKQRNLSPGSINVYKHALQKYESFNGLTLEELLAEADLEEEEKIRWKRRTIKDRLMDFRNCLIDEGYAKETINTMMKRVTTFYRHYDIEILHLPTVNIQQVSEIRIPTKDDLQDAVEISDPFMKAFILFLASSGLSKIDALSLTVGDFIKATKEYHTRDTIEEVLKELQERSDVIPTFSLTRRKTGKFHYTFCSPEASIAVVNYLQGRQDALTEASALFKMSYNWVTVKFEELNDALELGITEGNNFCVLRCHTLRKYHATTLRNDGLSIDIINSMQGKAKNKVDSAYFIDTPEELKKQYSEHVGCLAVNMDIRSVTVKSEEFMKLEKEIQEKNHTIEKYDRIFENIDERLQSLEKENHGPLSEDEFDDLFS
jgi:integrase